MKRFSLIAVLLLICVDCLAEDKIKELLSRLAQSTDEAERVAIISRDLWAINDPRIEQTFINKLSSSRTEESYYIAQYLAKLGHQKALGILCANSFKYPISSWQWSYTLREFGRHKYKPAIPVLIESLDAASLNVVDGAFESLRLFYPNSPSTFSSTLEMKAYFEGRYNQPGHGLPPG